MIVEQKVVRRRDRRIWYVAGGIFVAIFLFTFLTHLFKSKAEEVDAVNVANFDPGYIISDYQMSNYNSMSESEIQWFLKSKNSCNDTNINKYTTGEKVSYFSELAPPWTWHVSNGHFVCLADEDFNGESAAHIIYRAAQDYHINPQALIVLLEKEQSLITDTFPHSGQFRSATGYGCPDTAACSSKYYGFKNQVRNAAALFRTVLNGGWTNYPLGNNYVQYNPSASCGGSIVNIRNLATSALYRYTPYQPNAATLGGWNDGCNAYGNLNFYKLFENWFGGIVDDESYSDVTTPRYMEVNKDTHYINPYTGQEDGSVEKGKIFKFSTKIIDKDDEWCIRTAEDTKNNRNRCIKRTDLGEVTISFENIPESEQEKAIKSGAIKVNIRTGEKIASYDKAMIKRFLKKATLNSNIYYVLENDANNNSEIGILAKYIIEITYEEAVTPRYMRVKEDTNYIIPQTMEDREQVKKDTVLLFTTKTKDTNGDWCIRTQNDTDNNNNVCIERNSLDEADKYLPVLSPRKMQVVKDTYYLVPYTENNGELVKKNKIMDFDTKLVNSDGNWCIRTEIDTKNDVNRCIERSSLADVETYTPASVPRRMRIARDTYYINPQTLEKNDYVKKGTVFYFTTKVEANNGEWCIRTYEETNSDYNLCIYRKDLEEVL